MTAHGYARVSTADQNLDRQTDALAPLVDRLWCDRQSGKDMDRPRWRAMVSALRPGDVLYVASIDRMGRDYGDVCDAWASITALGVDIVVLDMPLLDTRESPGGGVTGRLISDVVIRLLAYVAQLEREKLRERQAQGIAAARARGKHLGRPRIARPDCYEAVREEFLRGDLTRRQAARRLQVSVSTFDRWRAEDGACAQTAG